MIYGTNAACALWLYPYHTVGFQKVLDSTEKTEHQNNIDDDDIKLMQKIIKYTPRPAYVQQIGKTLLCLLFSNCEANYLAMHWRYDKMDWILHCKRPNYKDSQTCHIVLNALDNLESTAEKIVDYVKLMQKQQKFVGMYIAAPLNAAPLISTIRKALSESLPGFKVITGEDSLPMVEAFYPKCEYLKENLHDVFSLVEMEICARSKLFLSSGGSSWSLNIAQERRIDQVDANDRENLEVISDGKVGRLDLEED